MRAHRPLTVFLIMALSAAGQAQIVTSAQCREVAERKQAECSRLYAEFRPLTKYDQHFVALSADVDRCFAQLTELRSQCQSLAMLERSRETTEQRRIKIEQDSAREHDRQIRLSTEQAVRANQSEQLQRERDASERARLLQSLERAEALRQREANEAKSGQLGANIGAALKMLSKPSSADDSAVDRSFDTSERVMKKPLQKYAMPGGSGGLPAQVQNKSLEEMRKYLKQVEDGLDDFLDETKPSE